MPTLIRVCLVLVAILAADCSHRGRPVVDITKTAKGFYEQTDANQIEILKTPPATEIIEVGTISSYGFLTTEEAKMHNSLRTKAAALGATAVLITQEGIVGADAGFGDYPTRWAIGVAIRPK